jgi:quinol monooxygenase YgiN
LTVVIAGSFRLPVSARQKAQAAMQRVVLATRAEAGCLAYSYAEDVLDPGLYRVSEVWESRELLEAHFNAPHMAQWKVERAELGMTERDIRGYIAGSVEQL